MSENNTKNQKFKFKKHVNIGSLAAEADSKFLETAFIEKNEFNLLCSMDSKRAIILGRTGSGKSALLQKMETELEHTRRIRPEELSFKYLCNSSILTFFQNHGIRLDLFYKLLWKHVFIVEILKLYFSGDKNLRSNWLAELFQSQQKKESKRKAIGYLNNFKDNFWEKTEYHIKDFEKRILNSFESKTGMKLQDLLEASIAGKNETESKISGEVINKAQDIVNEMQIDAIYEVLDILRDDLLEKSGKDHYIIIDDLDKEWVDQSIVYDLLRNLIQVIGELNNFPHIKIVISLRENLYQLVLTENVSRGSQREKFESLILKIEWNPQELATLVNKRLEEIMKGQYQRLKPSVDDILPKNRKNQKKGFEYILERTFMRPRDVIDFINRCIDMSDGLTEISFSTIREVEVSYSKGRLKAIEDEWLENYGDFRMFYPLIFANDLGFQISEITEDHLTSFLLEENPNTYHQQISKIYSRYVSDNNFDMMRKRIILVLYEIGLFGLKIRSSLATKFSFEQDSFLTIEEFSLDGRAYLHPAFHAYFNKVADTYQ